MSWASVRIVPSDNPQGRDAIVAALFALGAQAIVEDGPAIVTHFPATEDLERLRADVLRADPAAIVTLGRSPDVDWSVAWRASVTAHEIGELTVAPPWLAAAYDPARTIVIEPGMAFGTGDHASTRGVLALLPSVVRANDVVADLGSGSAVLAIAAAKLGAKLVYAIENDADALGNANANVRDNGVADRVHVLAGEARALLPLVAPVHVVLANIISSVLADLLPLIETSLVAQGRAILSGLLAAERPEWRARLAGRWDIQQERSEGDWWTLAIAKT